ncbi:MAG: hypothetical protein HWD58_07715 [Bacteroidota bacterium]|nr:MAG: hypothetical protein HWD58_07715 [Bacteroidota bacterium]
MWDPIAYKNVWDLDGQYAFSPDGRKFAYVKLYSQLYLADFDRCTGELYNSKLINIPIDTTPSPDPKYKYDSSGNGCVFRPMDSLCISPSDGIYTNTSIMSRIVA